MRAGDDAREDRGTAGAGSTQGDAARAGHGDIAGQAERRLDTVREIDAQRGADAERDRAGQGRGESAIRRGGHVVHVEFRDAGVRQHDRVRQRPRLAVLTLQGELTEDEFERSGAERGRLRGDDGARVDAHAAGPARIGAGDPEITRDAVASAERVDRLQGEATGAAQDAEQIDLPDGGGRDRRVGFAQVDDRVGAQGDRAGVRLVRRVDRQRAAGKLERQRDALGRGVRVVVGGARLDDHAHEVLVLDATERPRVGLDQGAGGDGVARVAGRIEFRSGDAGERDASEAGLGDGSAARKRAGEREHAGGVRDRPGLRGDEAHRRREDDGSGRAGLHRDALRGQGRREVEATTGAGERDGSRRDARGGAGREGERAHAEVAVEVTRDGRGGGRVALETDSAGLARQYGRGHRAGEVGRPAGESGGPVRGAGALPEEIAGDQRTGGERHGAVGRGERERGKAARGRAEQPVARAEDAGGQPAVRRGDERVSLVLTQAGVDEVEGDLVAGEEAERAAGREAEDVRAQAVAGGREIADVEFERRVRAARGAELQGGERGERVARAVGQAQRRAGADRDGGDDGRSGVAGLQGEQATRAGDAQAGRSRQRRTDDERAAGDRGGALVGKDDAVGDDARARAGLGERERARAGIGHGIRTGSAAEGDGGPVGTDSEGRRRGRRIVDDQRAVGDGGESGDGLGAATEVEGRGVGREGFGGEDQSAGAGAMRDDFVGAEGERAAAHDDRRAALREVGRAADGQGERAGTVLHQVETMATRAGEVALDQGVARAVHGPGAVERELGGAQAAREGDRLARDVLAEGDVGDVAAEVDDVGEGEGVRAGERLRGVVQERDGATEGARAADRFDRGVAEADADGAGGVGRSQAQRAAEDFESADISTGAGKGESAVARLRQDTRAADRAAKGAGGDRETASGKRGGARVGGSADVERARAGLGEGQGAAQGTDRRILGAADRQGRRGRRGVGDGAEAGEAGHAERVAVQVQRGVRVDPDQGGGREAGGHAQAHRAGGNLQGAGERGDGVQGKHARARLVPGAGAGEAGREGDIIGAEVEAGGETGGHRSQARGEVGGLRAGPAQGGVALEGDRAGAQRAGVEGQRTARETDAAGESTRAGKRQQAGAGLREALDAGEVSGERALRGDVETEEGAGGEIAGGERGDDVGLADRVGEGDRRAGSRRPAARRGESVQGGGGGDAELASGDVRLTAEAGGVAGEDEEARADLREGAATGEATGEAAGRDFEDARADRGQAREIGCAVEADGARARLGERADAGGGAGDSEGHAGRHVEHAARRGDGEAAERGERERSGGAETAAGEDEVIRVEAVGDVAQGGVHGDGDEAAGEDRAAAVAVARGRYAHRVDRRKREHAGAFLAQDDVAVERAREGRVGGLADGEGVERERAVGHDAGRAGERGHALVVAVEIEAAARGAEDEAGRDRERVGAAELQDAVVDAGLAEVGAGAGQQDDVLADLGEPARSGDGAVDLEVGTAQAGVGRVVGVGLVDLTLVVDAGEVPDAVAARHERLAEEGVGREVEGDFGAKLLDHRDVVPVTRHVTHDRAAVQGHRAAAGLVLHHLQVRAGGERVVARAGSVDRPALE